MSFGSLSLADIVKNVSNAFVGSIYEMYGTEKEDPSNPDDKAIRILMKENRYMYLALLILVLLIVGNLFFS